MRHPKSFAALVAIVCAAVLCGCTSALSGRGSADPALRGEWMLVSAHDASGVLPLTDSTVTLTIAGDVESTGEATCGSYTAALYGTAANLQVRAAATKKLDCQSPGASQLQRRYIAALDGVTRALVGSETLELSATGISLRFVPAPKVSYATIGNRIWELTSLSTPTSPNHAFVAAPQGEMFQLEDASHYAGTTGCRTFSGTYQLRSGKFVVLTRHIEPGSCSTAEKSIDASILSVFAGSFAVDSTTGSIQLTNTTPGVALFYLSQAQYLDQY